MTDLASPVLSGPLSAAACVVRRILHEPLVHFLVAGAVLFALNAVLSPAVPPERRIVVTPDVRKSIADTFEEAEEREPTPEELRKLLDTWVLNEITYREAMAQGFDKGDEMIRERLMQKMRLLIFSNLSIDTPTESDLQQWLESRRSIFDVPERISFFQLKVGGPAAGAEAESTLALINAGKESESVRLRTYIFADRPRPGLDATFGKDFVDRVAALPPGKWQTLQMPDAWHIVRLDRIAPPQHVEVGDVRAQLVADWKQERARALAVQVVHDMGKGYVIEGLDPR